MVLWRKCGEKKILCIDARNFYRVQQSRRANEAARLEEPIAEAI